MGLPGIPTEHNVVGDCLASSQISSTTKLELNLFVSVYMSICTIETIHIVKLLTQILTPKVPHAFVKKMLLKE